MFALFTVQLGACARYQRYQPSPVAPAAEASVYAARRLDDPGLASFLAAHGESAGNAGWDMRQLALAALYFRPDLEEARLAIAEAQAAEITAGTRPYPGVSVTADRAARLSAGDATPWSFSLTTGFTLETGGKRGARIGRARATTFAARLRLESLAWKVMQGARQAGLSAGAAEIDLRDAAEESAALRSLLALFRARYAEGQIARTELARSEADLQAAGVGETRALRARTDARSALARALAVPYEQIDGIALRSDERLGCAAVDSVRIDTLQTIALRTLPVVGATLGDYAVAEAELRLQIAQQYPDIVLGPGLGWDKGIQRWILSLAIPRIPIDRARGPIAEAAARRAMQGARVRVVQDSVLAAVDSSAANCRTSRREVSVADSLFRTTGEQLALAQASYQRGEIGKAEVALARLALVRAQRTSDQAAQRALASGAALEGATGLWPPGPLR